MPSGETCTGAAWLSSARVVRCRVKSLNERNPCLQLPACNDGDSEETAGVKPEEGGDDVKSSWPLWPGLHTSYNGNYKGKLTRESTQIPKRLPQFGLQAATRLHEAGIASNRRSAYYGEYVPEPCTHRPSSQERGGGLKSLSEPSGRRRLGSTPRVGLSRNKVAVGEPAAGSPPF